MKKVLFFTAFGVAMLALLITAFPYLAHALDITLDNVGSISAGSGSSSLNKALGIMGVIENTWFVVLDTIAVIILIAGAFVLRSRNPEKWSNYFGTLLAISVALAAPLIYKIIKELVKSIQ